MSALRVVVTGATGFIGSTVLHELALPVDGQGRDVVVRAAGRRAPTGDIEADEWACADLADPRSLAGVCEEADVLLHLAALVDGDESRCAAVNVRGTAALMDEALRAGLRRVVHLSTAAVYGSAPHREIDVDEIAPAPVSAASRTRLAGEAHALAAGATVLRPGLVLGPGDRWVVPAIAELLDSVPALWDGGRAMLSLVEVRDLARLIVRLALNDAPTGGRVWHASHPEPVRAAELVRGLARHGIVPSSPWRDLPLEACLERLRESGTRLSERQFRLFAEDFWQDSREVWHAADCPPGPGPLGRLADAAAWYRSVLVDRVAS
ncbi:NAD(P)-dependent oxidoreductase [Streptomyces lateritius]|uniref:NAD-dependent epimerase/dehydratase family protein n=1 Tax=Streptomyces lateritius TaxID=67313 RepID=UPI001C8BC915|nr:NAD-dependent epimerase/dehydratase family protein [Streptomyces lateritius]MBX9427547.1 NAD-dependent epimerase/dehydratase family protein [Streptomyces lateritius]